MQKKKQEGITLIALVVTIILMLILVGVTVGFLSGENGLITKTLTSREKAEIERYREIIDIDSAGPELEAGIRGLDDKSYMDKYQEALEQEALEGNLKGSEISRLEGREDETVRVVTPEGYVYDITREGVIYVGKQGEEDKNLPEINDGNIKFAYNPSGWTNNEVEVTIETDINIEKGYYLQYSTNGTTWKNYKEGFKVGENNTKVYARVVNGLDEHKGMATGNIENIDKKAPTVNKELTVLSSTTSSITLSTEVTDELSGLSKIIWYYKEETESDYKPIEEEYTPMNGTKTGDKTQIAKSKQITGLTAGKTYNTYAEVYDVAGNMTRTPTNGTKDQTTTGMPTGTITIKPSTANWTKNNVSFEITTTADKNTFKLQYATDPNGTWTDYNDSARPSLSANGTMYARLVEIAQPTNISDHATSNIKNIDKLAPNVPTFTETHDTTGVTITVTATDQAAQNGYAKSDIGLYYFSTNNGSSYTPAAGQITKSLKINLSPGTYTLKVKVKDNAGNEKESTQTTSITIEKSYTFKDLKVGDVVKYTPNTTVTSYDLPTNKSGCASAQTITKQTYTWKVLSINNDSIDIMGVPTSSMQLVYFKGPTGYNNGVYLLDEMCKTLYSNSKLNAEARSIDVEDIESKMNSNGISARNAYTYCGWVYGKTTEFTGDKSWYPNLARYENHIGIDTSAIYSEGIGESDDGTKLVGKITIPLLESDTSNYTKSKTKANSKITVKQTYYDVTQSESYYNDKNFYNLVFGTGTDYWLASRFSTPDYSCGQFGLRYVTDKKIQGRSIFASIAVYSEFNRRVSPVVSLKSNIKYTSAGSGVWNIIQ